LLLLDHYHRQKTILTIGMPNTDGTANGNYSIDVPACYFM
jgi:hypothetical protein